MYLSLPGGVVTFSAADAPESIPHHALGIHDPPPAVRGGTYHQIARVLSVGKFPRFDQASLRSKGCGRQSFSDVERGVCSYCDEQHAESSQKKQDSWSQDFHCYFCFKEGRLFKRAFLILFGGLGRPS